MSNGRKSKYDPSFAEEAYKQCLLGKTDRQLAGFFGISKSTLNIWKRQFPDFSDSLKRGKDRADAEVAAALYRRAIGFTFDEVTFEKVLQDADDRDIQDEAFRKKVVTKTVVPDTGAIKLWLSNRQKELWREGEADFSNLSPQQLDILIDYIKKNLHKL